MDCEAPSLAKQSYRFRKKCSHAGCMFVARGSTWLSCSTGMCRHIRETHGSAAHATRTRRQEQQAHAQQARRNEAHRAAECVVVQGHSKQHLFVVTCPLHRESMWLCTRDAARIVSRRTHPYSGPRAQPQRLQLCERHVVASCWPRYNIVAIGACQQQEALCVTVRGCADED